MQADDNGDHVRAKVVLSNLNAHTTLPDLVDAGQLDGGFRDRLSRRKLRGSAFKVALGLNGVPRFGFAADDREAGLLARCQFRIAPSIAYLERAVSDARAGTWSSGPLLWGTDPTRPVGTSLPSMRMLHLGLRVTDLERSLAFYTALGYAELGRVPETEFGSLTMLQLPDDPFVSLELVHDPGRPVKDISAVNHLVVQVDDPNATIADIATRGITAEPPTQPGPGIRTSWLTDPDGYRIELVQWPPGHPAGMTAADFA